MTGIEEKISRLPPELQREVEDYIDFLLRRNPLPLAEEQVPGFLSPPPATSPPRPIILAEEISFCRDQDILPGYRDLGQLAGTEGDPGIEKEPPLKIKKTQATDPGKRLLEWID
ncbi:MAG: hypothetical protein A4E37_01711 [Methanoregulaceae archaeon PtaB.Bin056]|jgi:hypothetical protein|nr:MAG: hypothetical protein A4E37_01711 [Methanoregulaceae archaeon PtaB.Bin056]